MKRRAVLLNAAALLALAACENQPSATAGIGAASERTTTLTVAVTDAENTALLEVARPLLERQGIALEVRTATAAAAGQQVQQGQADALCFYTRPFMDDFNRAYRGTLVALAGIDIKPRGIFSRLYTTWENVPGGSVVAIANDPAGRGRALQQLRRIGVIDLENPDAAAPNVGNISVNPLRLEFRQVPAADLTAQLDQADFVIMDVVAAEAAGMDPLNDALNVEDGLSRYANYLVTRQDKVQDARVTALATALTSGEVANYLEQSGGQVRAAFR